MSVAWGILSGVLVILIGQIPIQFVLGPMYEQRVAIRSIDEVLMRYAGAISNPGAPLQEYMDEASEAVREAACALQAKTNGVPFYGFFALLRLAPAREDVRRAHHALIGLSNSIHKDLGDNRARVKEVREALRISSDRSR